jgi:hypothetical protein
MKTITTLKNCEIAHVVGGQWKEWTIEGLKVIGVIVVELGGFAAAIGLFICCTKPLKRARSNSGHPEHQCPNCGTTLKISIQ